MKTPKKHFVEVVMFGVFLTLFALLIIKLAMRYQEKEVVVPIEEVEVIQHNYDDPKDLVNDTTLTYEQRKYYDNVYDY
jgi:hypothetical protein